MRLLFREAAILPSVLCRKFTDVLGGAKFFRSYLPDHPECRVFRKWNIPSGVRKYPVHYRYLGDFVVFHASPIGRLICVRIKSINLFSTSDCCFFFPMCDFDHGSYGNNRRKNPSLQTEHHRYSASDDLVCTGTKGGHLAWSYYLQWRISMDIMYLEQY